MRDSDRDLTSSALMDFMVNDWVSRLQSQWNLCLFFSKRPQAEPFMDLLREGDESKQSPAGRAGP